MIHCIGDSHVSFFSGKNAIQPIWPREPENLIPYFKTYRLGAILADGLTRFNSSLKGREQLSVLLGRNLPVTSDWIIPPKSRVLFCFGEIDCRFHVIKQSEKLNTSIESVATDLAVRYLEVVQEFKQLGYDTIVWNAIPPTDPPASNPDYPHYGTYAQRIAATEAFNGTLQVRTKALGIRYLSVYEKMILPDRRANMEFYMDQVHLGQKAMPLVLEELRKMFPEYT